MKISKIILHLVRIGFELCVIAYILKRRREKEA